MADEAGVKVSGLAELSAALRDLAPNLRRGPAMRALRAGAANYLTKPADVDEIIAAFRMANGLPVSRDPDLDIPVAPLRFDAADEHDLAAAVIDTCGHVEERHGHIDRELPFH